MRNHDCCFVSGKLIIWHLRCGIAYHNIIGLAFNALHGKQTNTMSSHISLDQTNQPMTATEYFESELLPSTSSEMFRKAMRVKALKTFKWLNQSQTVYGLLINNISVGPLERVMWVFMKWQDEKCTVCEGSSRTSVMSSSNSPARVAIKELLRVMFDGRISDHHDVTLEEIAEGDQGLFSLKLIFLFFCSF